MLNEHFICTQHLNSGRDSSGTVGARLHSTTDVMTCGQLQDNRHDDTRTVGMRLQHNRRDDLRVFGTADVRLPDVEHKAPGCRHDSIRTVNARLWTDAMTVDSGPDNLDSGRNGMHD